MKTFKEIHQEALQFEADNPFVPLWEAYQRGYVDAMKTKEPCMVTDEPVMVSEPTIFNEHEPTFDEFWNLYDKKRGRKKAEQKWNRLAQAEKVAIMEHVPKYVASTPDVNYRKDPLTYLNGECWNDEIITPNTQYNYGARQETQVRTPEMQFITDRADTLASLAGTRGKPNL